MEKVQEMQEVQFAQFQGKLLLKRVQRLFGFSVMRILFTSDDVVYLPDRAQMKS